MISIKFDPRMGIWAEDAESTEKLRKNFFGEEKKGKVILNIEEALYILDFLNGACSDRDGNSVSFGELAAHYAGKESRLFIKYNAYRDWRDRGLIVSRFEELKSGRKVGKSKYPSGRLEKSLHGIELQWYGESLFSLCFDQAKGKELFTKNWFGQMGVYRQERGDILKLDFMETIFLGKHMGAFITDARTGKQASPESILEKVVKEREYAEQLYNVYEDWRLRGYVVKTGFKFGSHFRIYFPGASPAKTEKWIHSRHVLHVFPKEQKLIISEWARAVRVAHSVKKTFLLSIPEMKPVDYVDYPTDFIAYRRKKEGSNWIRETPEDRPRYLLVSVSEDEHIGGVELASLLKKAKEMCLELLLSITDRETSITYYLLKQIELPGSSNEYYEIEWMKP